MLFSQHDPHDILNAKLILGKGIVMNDLVGKSIGKWKVLSFDGRDKKSNRVYTCQCACGLIKIQRECSLVKQETTQCKSCRMKELNKVSDLTGQVFGSWNVLRKIKNESRNEWFYECICKCGTLRQIPGHQLISKTTTKCNKCRPKIHGMSNTPTFRIWTGILRRCLNPNFKGYKYYGGRGIKVCDRWLKFQNFFEDMGIRPANLHIDRIDNDGNYEPSNCRWVTAKENNANRKFSKNKKEN